MKLRMYLKIQCTLGGGLASKEQISLKPLPSCIKRLRSGKVKRGALSAGSS